MAHYTYARFVLFGSTSSFASTTALARSIGDTCGIPPYLSALETRQSDLRTSFRRLCSQSGDARRNRAQHLCSQSGHSGTQQNICATNQVRFFPPKPSSFSFDSRATQCAHTSTRSINFCAIWVCISSSSRKLNNCAAIAHVPTR